MKAVKIKFLTKYNAILAALLSLLGFSSSCGIFPGTEYGTPHAKFIVNGNIVSATTNQAVQGIKVKMAYDSTTSSVNGIYSVKDGFGFPQSQTYTVTFRDIDGAANGQLQDLDTTIEFKDPKFTNGDGHWYEGETTKELDIKLKPK